MPGDGRKGAGNLPSATSVDGRVRATLRKEEILRGKKNFAQVFSSGLKFSSLPVVCIVRAGNPLAGRGLQGISGKVDTHQFIRVAFVVRRSVKRAIDRNRIKRLLREAYRRNKDLLSHPAAESGTFRNLIFLYSPGPSHSVRDLTYEQIDACMKKILRSVKGGT